MKNIILIIAIIPVVTNLGFSQQTFYDVTAGDGNGLRLWSSDMFKIHMGNGVNYNYGPVTNYSMKFNMSTETNRGWTWGIYNAAPIAAMNTQGNFQIAGQFTSSQINVNALPSGGGISIAGNTSAFVGSDLNVSRSSSQTSAGRGANIQFNDNGSGSYNLIQNSSAGLQFFNYYNNSGWVERMRLLPNGNLGIGNLFPVSAVTVNGNIQISNSSIPMGLMTEVGGYNPILNLSMNFREPDKNNTYRGAAFRIDSRDDFPLFQWLSRDAGSSTDNLLMALLQNGNVGIGTTSPTQKLTVNGTVYSKEVKVDVGAGAPDYVFEKDYKLPSLEEIKSYVDQHKHLPEVPSAKDMEQNGINLSEMNMILLKKVEELTLHIIQLEERLQKVEHPQSSSENKK